jgi:dCMP deaminase
MTVNAGIKRVVANIEYPDNTFKELFSLTGIEFSTLQLGNFSIDRLL